MDNGQLRPGPPRRLRRWELVALDALAAVGYTVAFLAGPLLAASHLPGWLRWTVGVTIIALVTARRQWPLPAFLLVLGVSLWGLSAGLIRDPLLAAGYVLYPLALTVPRRRWEPTAAIAVISGFVLVLATVSGPAPPDSTAWTFLLAALGLALLGGVWTVGRAVSDRRAHARYAARILADRAVAEERLRIARELHDVVSHTLSVIGVKAAIANHVADARPEEARDALLVIERTSRDALTEMRRILGLLRSAKVPVQLTSEGLISPGLDPVPGLAQLPDLVDRAALAGVRVRLRVSGVSGLPRGVELSVYRIVQEAVTNVVKHAAPASCQAIVAGGAGGVSIEVTDDGPGVRTLPAPGPDGEPGHGLIGIRERALLHGGEITAGPVPGGGFRVSVWLPHAAEERVA